MAAAAAAAMNALSRQDRAVQGIDGGDTRRMMVFERLLGHDGIPIVDRDQEGRLTARWRHQAPLGAVGPEFAQMAFRGRASVSVEHTLRISRRVRFAAVQ